MMKKVVTFLLSTALVFGSLSTAAMVGDFISNPISVEAASKYKNVVDTGFVGTNITWTITKSGTLYIDGEGEIANSMPSIKSFDWQYYANTRDNNAGLSVNTVIIEDKITNVPYAAFANFVDLQSVKLSIGTKTIANEAFLGCKSLKKIDLPYGLKSIDDKAFHNAGLEEIIIPATVNEIVKNPFNWCDNLVKLTVDSNNKTFYSKSNALYEKSTETLKAATNGTKTISNSAKIIGEMAFLQSRLKSIEIPCSIVEIKDSAFAYSDFTTIKIPDSVETIGGNLFRGCKKLKNVYIPDIVNYTVSMNQNFQETNALENVYFGGNETKWIRFSAQSNISDSVKATCNYQYTCHKWDDGVVTQKATKDKDGVKTYTCAMCKKTRTEVIPKTGGSSSTGGDEGQNTTDKKDPSTIVNNGPATGQFSFIRYNTGDGYKKLFTTISGEDETPVSGLSYDKATNTLTISGFTGDWISINQMGADFTLKLAGNNNLKQLWCWGDSYGSSLKITGNGTLNIANDDDYGITLSGENSNSRLLVDTGVTIDIKSGKGAIHVSDTYNSEPIVLANGVVLSSGKINKTDSKDKDGYKLYTASVAEKNVKLITDKSVVSVATTKITKATAGKDTITVSLKKVSGVSGYQIRYSLKKNMKSAMTVTIKGTKKKITKLVPGKKYYIQVRSYTVSSGTKSYGKWSAKKAVKTKTK